MSISTPRDNNGVPAILGTLDSDGVTVVPIQVNPVNHAVKFQNGDSGTSFNSTTAQRDDNRVTALWGVSSADGVTPIYIAVNSDGKILTKST